MTDAPKLLLDFQELADALGVHIATVYRLRDRGELPIPILHLGRSPRVRTVDVERWLEHLAEDAGDITTYSRHKQTPVTATRQTTGARRGTNGSYRIE